MKSVGCCNSFCTFGLLQFFVGTQAFVFSASIQVLNVFNTKVDTSVTTLD